MNTKHENRTMYICIVVVQNLFLTTLRTHLYHQHLHHYLKDQKIKSSKKTRTFKRMLKRFGPARKLCAKDEILLCLIKLRLGITLQDLAT